MNTTIKTKYLRLLSYDNACKVINFINKLDNDNYSYITIGEVGMQVKDSCWQEVEDFIKSLNARYEIGFEHPYVVTQNIISDLKATNVIKQLL